MERPRTVDWIFVFHDEWLVQQQYKKASVFSSSNAAVELFSSYVTVASESKLGISLQISTQKTAVVKKSATM